MQRLSSLTNLIPIVAKSDTLSADELVAIKTSILARLQTSSIKPFFFGNAVDDALLAVQELSLEQSPPAPADNKSALEPKEVPFPKPTHPYVVSSTLGSDTETMDASLLMSPDYVQPLLPSELAALVTQVFDPESISWLRHSAAKKFIAWRRRAKLSGDSFILQSLHQETQRRGSASTSASIGLNGAAMNSENHLITFILLADILQHPRLRLYSLQSHHQEYLCPRQGLHSMPPTSNHLSQRHLPRLQIHNPKFWTISLTFLSRGTTRPHKANGA